MVENCLFIVFFVFFCFFHSLQFFFHLFGQKHFGRSHIFWSFSCCVKKLSTEIIRYEHMHARCCSHFIAYCLFDEIVNVLLHVVACAFIVYVHFFSYFSRTLSALSFSFNIYSSDRMSTSSKLLCGWFVSFRCFVRFVYYHHHFYKSNGKSTVQPQQCLKHS